MSGGWLGLVKYWTRTAISVVKDGMLERLGNRGRSFTQKSTPRHMDSLIQDLRYTVRSFARRPAFFLVAFITVALGIGSTTTIYSVVDGVLARWVFAWRWERMLPTCWAWWCVRASCSAQWA